MVTPDALDVYLYGTHVAVVTRSGSTRLPGRPVWSWTASAADRWGLGARVVSHSLPVQAPGERPPEARVASFVDGLLPEGELRTRRASELGIDPDDTYALWHRTGLDTAGALVVTAHGEPLPEPAGVPAPIELADIAVHLTEAGGGRLHGTLTSISLAGLVPKIGLIRDGAGWAVPAPGQPSTWIVKAAHPAGSPVADVVDTEALCLDLGRRAGVTTVEAEVLDLGDTRAIAVQRYDRVDQGRLHQEDLAQAIGLATADPERKFQRGRRLPSWRHAAEVVRAGGGALSRLARLVTFSYLVGNSDHHAKNTSFVRFADGSVSVAPAYDIAAHLHHPGAHVAALDLAGKRRFDELTLADVADEIASWGVPMEAARAAVDDVLADLRRALAEVDRDLHAGVPPAAWRTLERRVG